jgi:hypothetical protein
MARIVIPGLPSQSPVKESRARIVRRPATSRVQPDDGDLGRVPGRRGSVEPLGPRRPGVLLSHVVDATDMWDVSGSRPLSVAGRPSGRSLRVAAPSGRGRLATRESPDWATLHQRIAEIATSVAGPRRCALFSGPAENQLGRFGEAVRTLTSCGYERELEVRLGHVCSEPRRIHDIATQDRQPQESQPVGSPG